MITLTDSQKKVILFCKGHLTDKYPSLGYSHKILKPLFAEIFGWNPDEDDNYRDYLQGAFNYLLDLYLKIACDKSGSNHELKELFGATFSKGISYDAELPIERSIDKLCGMIQCNLVVDNDVKRYELL